MKQLLTDLKGDTDSNAVIVGEPNTPLTSMERLMGQKRRKEAADLKQKTEQMDIVDIYRHFIPQKEYTFFPLYVEPSLVLTTI